MNAPRYRKGDRVKHPGKLDWGLGEVLEDSAAAFVRVFFVGAGERQLSLEHVTLEVVRGDERHHPVLDNLKMVQPGKRAPFVTLPQAISRFLERYPQGFYGEKYFREERDYKVKAHNLMLETLGTEPFEGLVRDKNFDEICKRALRVVNSTNLLFPNEKMDLKDGLVKTGSSQLFSEALYRLLFDSDAIEARFKGFCGALEEIGAAKWTTATYFLFLQYPQKHVFLKPMVTQHAAEVSRFEINYRPELNWLTYHRVLEFAEYLRKELAELKPRDMIDVQSFMWCIAPDQ